MVQPMTPEMLAQLAALRLQHEDRGPAPRTARSTERVPPPSAHAPEPVEDAEPVDVEASTRMLDAGSMPELLRGAPDEDAATRMLDLAPSSAPAQDSPAPGRDAAPQPQAREQAPRQQQAHARDQPHAREQAPHQEQPHAREQAPHQEQPHARDQAPREQEQARRAASSRTPPGEGAGPAPDESAIPGLPRMPVAPDDASAGSVSSKPIQQLGYAFRHLKAMGVVRLAEHTLDRRGTFLEEEHGRTLEEIGFALWRGGVRVRGHEDAYATLDSLRGRREELEAAVREQEGAVAQEKEIIKSELDEAAYAVAESDHSLSTLVANLRAVDTELAASRRDQGVHKRGAEAAKKEIATLKGAKGGADAGRIASLEADVARHQDAAAPLDDLITTLQKRHTELTVAESIVRAKVTPLRQQESRLRARIATKDREVVARTHATREQLTGVAKEMSDPARRIGQAADANRGAFPAHAQSFFKLDAIELVRAHDLSLRDRFASALAVLDDAQAKKGWIIFGAIAAVVVVLLVVLSLIF